MNKRITKRLNLTANSLAIKYPPLVKEWQATINHRTRGTGCPKCNPAYSIPELRIFSELRAIFQDVQHRAIIQNHEVDIYI